ncbi:MAG: VanZ family protein [Gammaproteobacteria bacterium]
MRELRWRWFWLASGTALVLLVTWLCLRPSAGGDQWFPHADKFQHAAAFLGLGGLLLALFERRHYAVACIALLVFGGAIEVAQYLMPYGRSAEWADLAADGLGIVLAALVSLAIQESWLQRIERWLGARG